MKIVQEIGDAFTPVCAPKCPTATVFRNSTAPNALTFVSLGSMKIVYSPTFFVTISKRYGSDGLVGIIAHEYGHIIDAVSLGTWMNTNWTPELRADAWAGCAFAMLKLNSRSLEQALTVILRYPAASQPNWTVRVPPLRTGYRRCGGTRSDFDKSAATLAPDTTLCGGSPCGAAEDQRRKPDDDASWEPVRKTEVFCTSCATKVPFLHAFDKIQSSAGVQQTYVFRTGLDVRRGIGFLRWSSAAAPVAGEFAASTRTHVPGTVFLSTARLQA